MSWMGVPQDVHQTGMSPRHQMVVEPQEWQELVQHTSDNPGEQVGSQWTQGFHNEVLHHMCLSLSTSSLEASGWAHH